MDDRIRSQQITLHPSDKINVFNQHGYYIETVFMDSSLSLFMVNNHFSCTRKKILDSTKTKLSRIRCYNEIDFQNDEIQKYFMQTKYDTHQIIKLSWDRNIFQNCYVIR